MSSALYQALPSVPGISCPTSLRRALIDNPSLCSVFARRSCSRDRRLVFLGTVLTGSTGSPPVFWIKLQQVGTGDKGGEEEEEEKLKAEANLPGILMSHLGALPEDDFPIAPYGGKSTAQRSAAGNSSPTAVPLNERQHRENAAGRDQHTWSIVLPITSGILVKGYGDRSPPCPVSRSPLPCPGDRFCLQIPVPPLRP